MIKSQKIKKIVVNVHIYLFLLKRKKNNINV